MAVFEIWNTAYNYNNIDEGIKTYLDICASELEKNKNEISFLIKMGDKKFETAETNIAKYLVSLIDNHNSIAYKQTLFQEHKELNEKIKIEQAIQDEWINSCSVDKLLQFINELPNYLQNSKKTLDKCQVELSEAIDTCNEKRCEYFVGLLSLEMIKNDFYIEQLQRHRSNYDNGNINDVTMMKIVLNPHKEKDDVFGN